MANPSAAGASDQQVKQQQQQQQNKESSTSSTNQPAQDEAAAAPTTTGETEQVKQFSDKTLQELADYYLNLEPADIPDSGFVVSGIGGRFPNADNLNELWDNLLNGKDMVLGPDDKRWPLGEFLFDFVPFTWIVDEQVVCWRH